MLIPSRWFRETKSALLCESKQATNPDFLCIVATSGRDFSDYYLHNVCTCSEASIDPMECRCFESVLSKATNRLYTPCIRKDRYMVLNIPTSTRREVADTKNYINDSNAGDIKAQLSDMFDGDTLASIPWIVKFGNGMHMETSFEYKRTKGLRISMEYRDDCYIQGPTDVYRAVNEMIKNVKIAWLWYNKNMTSNDMARWKIVAFLMCQMPDVSTGKLPEHFQDIMAALESMYKQDKIDQINSRNGSEYKRARHY